MLRFEGITGAHRPDVTPVVRPHQQPRRGAKIPNSTITV